MEREYNKILLIGNGFDRAHNLQTSYGDLLFLMKNWDEFMKYFTNYRNRNLPKTIKRKFDHKYDINFNDLNEKNILKMNELINGNCWAQYFINCGADIDLWIDFEKEIYPVLEIFNNLLNEQFDYRTGGVKLDNHNERLGSFFSRYYVLSNGYIIPREMYIHTTYGICKKKILNDLKDEFMRFIEFVELYFGGFVEPICEKCEPINQIASIKADYVITFNYTHTEKIYGYDTSRVHHIHGEVRNDLKQKMNNMVLGVNDNIFQNNDFIYFLKYFQRIQKHCGIEYKNFIMEPNLFHTEESDNLYKEYVLYIYGHSLDISDRDVFYNVIGELDKNGNLGLKPRKVTIFYLNQEDYESKIINLINLYGRVCVEKCIDDGLFYLKEINNSKIGIV